MTTITAQTRFDEPITLAVLTQAVERGRKRSHQGVHATGVQYVPLLKSLLVSFADQTAVALPLGNYAELAVLSDAELGALTLGFGGSALCLESRDLHVTIAGLVAASQPLMDMAASLIAARNGGKRSAAKVEAARANGRKGGRPRVVVVAA